MADKELSERILSKLPIRSSRYLRCLAETKEMRKKMRDKDYKFMLPYCITMLKKDEVKECA